MTTSTFKDVGAALHCSLLDGKSSGLGALGATAEFIIATQPNITTARM